MIDLTNSQDEVTCVDDDDAALPPKVDNAGPVQQRAAKPRAVDDPGEEFRGDGAIELCQTVGAVHKFFLIQLRGSSVTTTFGRVVDGTKQGRPNEPEAFASRSEALAHANTILSRTLGAGYRLAAGGGAAYVELPKADGGPPTKRPRKGGDTGGSTKQPKAAKAKAAAASGDGVSGRPDFAFALAGTWDSSKHTKLLSVAGGYSMSENLDGIRALWDGKGFMTKFGNMVQAPEFFTASLPSTVRLDGELFGGRDTFDKVSGLVRSGRVNDPARRTMRFCVFDAPDASGAYAQRMASVPPLGAHVEKVPYKTVASLAAMEAEHARVLALGAEGLMVRCMTSTKYMPGRTQDILKVKQFTDSEAFVTGYNFGGGQAKDKRSLVLRLRKDDPTSEFSCTVAGAVVNDPPPIGALVTVKYFELTKKGVPRFPAYKGLRTD